MNNIILHKSSFLRLAVAALALAATAPTAPAQNGTETRSRADSNASTHAGKVFSTSNGQLTMTINGQNKHSHKITRNTQITLNGKPAALQDLQRGDAIQVTIGANNVAQEIDATRPEVKPRTEPQQAKTGTAKTQEHVFLGIAMEPSEGAGVFIPEVAINGPAEKAGIRRGDYVLSVNGTKVSSPEELDQQLSAMRPGDEAKLVTWRDGQKHEVTAKLVARQIASYRPFPVDDEENADAPAAWLGVLLTEPEGQTDGVKIERVHPEGPAAQAGVQAGDILSRINDQQVTSADNASQMLAGLKPGTQVNLVLLRNGERQTVSATLGDRTEALGDSASDLTSQSELEDVPEHFMMLEQHRHFAKQHERIEQLCYQLLEEVQALRKEVKELKSNQAASK